MIQIKIDQAAVQRQMNDLVADQLPYATSRALTWLAVDCQTEIKRQLPQRFTLRNAWVKKGVRMKAATKTRLQSEVFHLDDYMERQEDGGIKYPLGRHLAIPVRVAGTARGIIKGNNRPKALLSKGSYKASRKKGGTHRVFKIDESTPDRQRHGMHPGIYMANGNNLMLLYRLIPKGNVKKRWEFETTCKQVVNSRFERLFQLSLSQALG